MSDTRIPQELPDFDSYIGNADDHLGEIVTGTTTRGEDLGMDPADVTELHDYRIQWRSGDPASPGLYEIHLNPKTKSQPSRADIVKFMKDFSKFFRPILTLISVSKKITPASRIVLNIAEPDPTYTIPTDPIIEQCLGTAMPLGGCKMDMEFRYRADASRPSKAAGADALLLIFRAADKYVSGPELTGGKVRNLPTSPRDPGMEQMVYTEAKFILDLGIEKQDLELQYYAQWINTRHRNLDGPITGPYTAPIN